MKERITNRLWKITPGWVMSVFFCGFLFILGAWAYWNQLKHGFIVTGLRTPGVGGASWGLYIVFDVFFVGVSFAGISTSALVRLFNLTELKPITRAAELLTLIALILGGLSVLADQGRIFHSLLNLPRFARVMSPLFGTFTLVIAGYFFASLVYFFLAGRADAWELSQKTTGIRRIFYKIWAIGFSGKEEEFKRHHTSSFWLAIFILPLLVTAHSTLGFIFGIQGGRPGWFSTLQAPGFVVMAGVSGIGFIIIIAYLIRRIYRIEDIITEKTFKTLGIMLMILTIAYIYFMIVEELTSSYAAPQEDREVAHEVVFGTYSPYFWITVLCLVIPFIMLFYQFVSGKTHIGLTVLSGLLVNVAAFTKRFVIVVPSQTHGLYIPYIHGEYSPTIIEILVIAGLFGIGGLMYIIFAKVFPIVPLESFEERPLKEVREHFSTRMLRLSATFLTLAVGISLMIIGFLASARFWTKYYLDPVIPFSPVVFILGVMLSFISAIVYEIIPGKYRE